VTERFPFGVLVERKAVASKSASGPQLIYGQGSINQLATLSPNNAPMPARSRVSIDSVHEKRAFLELPLRANDLVILVDVATGQNAVRR
jgi:hypothetical protein